MRIIFFLFSAISTISCLAQSSGFIIEYDDDSTYVNIKPSSIPPNFKEMSYCRNLASLLEYQELRNYFIEGIGKEILSEDERNIARTFGYTIRSTV